MSRAPSLKTSLRSVPAGAIELEALCGIPDGAAGIVLFAHGSGSSRHSPRNSFVADALQRSGIATVLLDLLTEREAADRANVFDVAFLATRLRAVTDWVRAQAETRQLPVGYFGASTGAAAALIAAASDSAVAAVVSRGGRPDLADVALGRVQAPTLLIVGGDDHVVIRLNEEAYARLCCEKEMRIVAGAGHLFEESGTLEEVVRLATKWYERYLRGDERRAI
jgi:putative phosphoribosyl transferase